MATPTTRAALVDHCLRRLGAPVLDINIDEDQIEDRVDDTLQIYQEYHMDATFRTYFKYLVTSTDVTNEYIPIPTDILTVKSIFPISASGSTSVNFFDVKYQIMANDVYNLGSFGADLAYYEQLQQYMSMIDQTLNGTPQVSWSRKQNRLYIFGDFKDKDIKAGDYIIAEVSKIIDPGAHSKVFSDMFVKDYLTALLKQQWGQNLIKFQGMTLPGGVTLDGRQFYDDGTADIERLREAMRLEFEEPHGLMVG